MSYDQVVAWTSIGSLILFVSLAVYITINVYRPSKRAEMDRLGRIPLDMD